ncbi:MAG: NADH-quinone oxidoreductase subunit C [Gemmatimonadales bacterium]|nr:MAG: NADH-quinone oxidoreductase subunit C [Gemmatimonadales bacterium]
MADETRSGLDAVEEGPAASEDAESAASGAGTLAPEHPSVKALRARFGEAIHSHEVGCRGQHVVFVDAARSREILEWLRDDPDHHYQFLSDLTAVDYGGGRPLHVVYQLFSMTHHRSLRVKCVLPVTALEIDSVEPLWKTADWLEREVYDLFGIRFNGHPDLRRILMPENYAEGHPLRKDFPLRGRFSRAEQTRRALSQEVADFYIPEEMEIGRDPQVLGHEQDGDALPSGENA